MPSQDQEFKLFGIPVWLRKYLYGGFLTLAIGALINQTILLNRCQDNRSKDKDKIYQDMKAIFDAQLKTLSERLNPPIQNMKERVDSIHDQIIKPK
jgi:hypothetical protein